MTAFTPARSYVKGVARSGFPPYSNSFASSITRYPYYLRQARHASTRDVEDVADTTEAGAQSRARDRNLFSDRAEKPIVPNDQPADQSSNHESMKGKELRLPRNVQSAYLRPLRRHAKYGVPSCDLQLRSFNVRNVEFFADFALRAAYYLNLPASGPIPLPRLVERWTVPKGNFAHKKSQENFERITLRRLVQVQDGHPETVEIWLAFLRKHAYYGVGMKANIWELNKLGVGKTMDVNLESSKTNLDPAWAHFGRNKNVNTSEKVLEMMNSEKFRRMDDGPFAA